MNDRGDDMGDFADEPTDPGPGSPQDRPTAQQGAPPEAVNNLGFRPQTGAFGAVGGHPGNQSGPGQNPFGQTQSRPNYQPPQNQGGGQPQSGTASGGFAPPMTNPTGSFNVSTGEFSAPNQGSASGQFQPPGPNSGQFQAQGHASGQFQAPGPPSGQFHAQGHASGQFQAPGPPSGQFQAQGPATGQFQAPNQNASGFGAPMTGGFQAVQNQQQPTPHPHGNQPGHNPVGSHPNQPGGLPTESGPGTGPLPSVGGPNTGSFHTPANQSLQIGEFVDGPPEPTIKIRALYGFGGFVFGFVVGIGLGLLNSLFEGADLVAGIGVSLQIAIWFGGMIGLIAAWKPQKVWETLENYGFFD